MYGYEIFHNEIMEKLIKSVREGTHSHAYIFSGERGLGKTEAARLLANTLVCTHTSSAPCGTCPGCIQAKAHTNPDIKYIDSKDKKSIGVETIREINEDVCIKPFGTGAKVYIITEGSLMTESAQNAFLKTLEEPPSYAVFIILTEDTGTLLQTVISRCAVISFHRVSREKLRSYTERKYPDKAEFLSAFAEGNPGRADRYMTDDDYRTLRESSVKALRNLLSNDLGDAYTTADFLESNKDNLTDVLDFWMVLIRDMLFSSSGCNDQIINRDIMTFLRNQSSLYDEQYLINAENILAKAHEMCRRNVNIRALGMNISIKIKQFSKI